MKKQSHFFWLALVLLSLSAICGHADTNGPVTTSPAPPAIAIGGIPTPALLAAGILALMRVVKSTPIDNRWIPTIALLLGAIGEMAITKQWDVTTAITGLLLGGGATGVHQAVRAPLEAHQETGETTFLTKKDVEDKEQGKLPLP